jgi:phage FluMu protein Com
MGGTAIYICNNCHREFRASGGGGFQFFELRCERCDRVVSVPRENWPSELDLEPSDGSAKYASREELESAWAEFKCPRCKIALRDDLGPMCRACKSRDLSVKEIEVLYD